LPLALFLNGCSLVVMDPSGHVAMQQRDLIVIASILMLIIIIPVMALTVYFAWKYRQSNRDAEYDPEWHHSTHLELVIWSAPLAIIIALGAVTWVSTHTLDPYRPLERISSSAPVTEKMEQLNVEVVSLNWKWLFIYPDQGFATVNELAAPVDTPINFKVTSSDIMNSFFVPALAGQIYAMAGMETKLHAVINEPGVYDGFSANFSGDGFSHMNFKFHGMSSDAFRNWTDKVRASDAKLDITTYKQLEKPSEDVAPAYYSSVDPTLYDKILNMCVDPSQMCIKDMAAAAQGSGGMEIQRNLKSPGINDAAPAQ
jgi:cytochrome o ubiquinol oxidase subunit 2